MEHGDAQMLEQYLKVLHLVGNRKPTETVGSILSIGNLKALPQSDTFPPTRANCCNKARPSNSATHYEIMGDNYVQTTTESIKF